MGYKCAGFSAPENALSTGFDGADGGRSACGKCYIIFRGAQLPGSRPVHVRRYPAKNLCRLNILYENGTSLVNKLLRRRYLPDRAI